MSKSRPEFTLTQLTYFIRAAEFGSMTDAAAELFVAQSAVSTAVQHLERTLETQLFIRHRTKGLQLTSTGEDLLTRARVVLGAVDDTLDAFRPDALSGTLHAACYQTLAPFFLPQVIQELTTAHPAIEPHIREATGDEIVRLLANRAIDIALTYDLGLGDGITKEHLATAPVYVALAKDDPLAMRGAVSLHELTQRPMILLDMPVSRDYFTGLFAMHGLIPNVRYRFASFESVRAMVARGHGFTFLHQRPAYDRSYDGRRLAAVRLEEDVPGLDIVLATREGEPLSRKADAFADEVRLAVQVALNGAASDAD